MKKIIIVMLWITPLISAMEEYEHFPQTTHDSVSSVSDRINNYYSHPLVPDSIAQFFLTEEQMFHIMSLAQQPSIENFPTDECMTALSQENTFFKASVDHFIKLARNGIENITCSTLASFENATEDHPVMQLNLLAEPVKKYVMDRALKTIDYEWGATITPKDRLHSCAICPQSHLLACALGKSIEIFNLKNLSLINKLFTHLPALQLCFNSTGSHLATIEKEHNYTIRVYDIVSGNALYTINLTIPIAHIDFLESATHNILSVFETQDSKHFTQKNYYFKDGQAHLLGELFLKASDELYTSSPTNVKKGDYKTVYSSQSNILHLTKKHCHSLYVCSRAINNTTNSDTLDNVVSSSFYDALTDYEQGVLQQQLQRQKQILAARDTINKTLEIVMWGERLSEIKSEEETLI